MIAIPYFVFSHPVLFGLLVLTSMVAVFHLGRTLGRRRPATGDGGIGLMDGAVFALVGLLLAFTFTSAAGRFEARRERLIEEANAIGTAQLRLDLLPANVQGQARALLDRYVETRLETMQRIPRPSQAAAAYQESVALQGQLWALATAAGRQPDALPAVNIVLLPALNQMFDIAATRMIELRFHTPLAVFLFLWVSALLATLLAGHISAAAGSGYWVHLIAFSLVMTVALYAIVDFEFPRAGLIRVDGYDNVLKGDVLPPDVRGPARAQPTP